ncbi:hypothetical protein AX14_000702 [Amanita brunnescens Koide BX004]|nr:hypothetical protein AX14_000702 [Amanita brunnescens Koide BX004]
MSLPVVKLKDLSFVRCDVRKKTLVGTFTATADSPLGKTAVKLHNIKYEGKKIGIIKPQTLDFSGGSSTDLEAHFFGRGPDLRPESRKFLNLYWTTNQVIDLKVTPGPVPPGKTGTAVQFEAKATGSTALNVENIVAWIGGSTIAGHGADYSITITHPLPQLGTLEIIELSFIASVGGDDLLEGKLEDFIIEENLAKRDTDRRPAKLCRNQLTTLWDVSMYDKVEVKVTSASVKYVWFYINPDFAVSYLGLEGYVD